MNFKSVRFRLTLWYSLAFFISTAVVFAAFYFITKQTLLSQTDATINSHAKSIITIVAKEQPNMMSGAFSQGIIAQQFSDMPGMLVVIADPTGKILNSSQTGASENSVITDLLEKSSGLIKSTFVDRTIGTTSLRLGIFPIQNNSSLVGLALVGHPVDVIKGSLNRLLLILMGVYLLFFIPTLIGSFLLAKGAMQPINKLSSLMKRVSGENLNETIEIPKTGDEIQELAQSFNSLLQRLLQAFQRERQFIGDVAHELKTPLSTVKSSVEIALSKARTQEEYKNVLSETLVDIDKLGSTINNVLDLAWSEADHTKSLTESFNLSELMGEIKELSEKMAKTKHIKVWGNIAKNLKVIGRQEKIFRAILNIVDNAIKYTPNNGSVSINLIKENDKAKLTITDSGVGISPNELPKVFDRFYRGSKTEKVMGSGLGLAISSSIISVHNGSIQINSKLGKGTNVIISLPL